MNPTPMFSPFPPAKLFQRFVFEQDITVDGVELEVELNNYVNYKKIKWVFDGSPQKGNTQPIKGLMTETEDVYIKTNSVDEMKKGDMLFLVSPLWLDGKYFTVAGEVKKDFVYTPKPRMLFQHVILRTLGKGAINE